MIGLLSFIGLVVLAGVLCGLERLPMPQRGGLYTDDKS